MSRAIPHYPMNLIILVFHCILKRRWLNLIIIGLVGYGVGYDSFRNKKRLKQLT
jgi:hypothetical protein